MLSRMNQQTRQMVGMADKTIDPVFDNLEVQYKQTCAAVAKLEKAAKYHQSAIISTMGALTQAKSELERTFPADDRQAIQLYEQAVAAVLQNAKPKFGEVYEGRAFAPLEKYKDDLAAIGARVKERANCQIDYDIARRKVKDLISKPGKDGSVLQAAEVRQEETKVAYEAINEEMTARIQDLQAARTHFFASFLKGVMEASATYTSQANKQIMPRIKPLGDYIASIPPPSTTEAQAIDIDMSSPNAAAGAAAGMGAPVSFDQPAAGTPAHDAPSAFPGSADTFGGASAGGASAGGLYAGNAAAEAYGAPVGFDQPAAPPAPAPAPQPAAAAPPAPAAGGDPWDKMFGGSLDFDAAPQGGGSAI